MTTRIAMRQGLARAPTFSVGWHDAVFEHYRVTDEPRMQALLPPGIELDLHNGSAYLSVVSFRMNDMRWRQRIRLPFSHTYPQINVRVYVRSQDKYGVVFLRNYVSHRFAAWAGRRLYGVPYRFQKVTIANTGSSMNCRARLASNLTHEIGGVQRERLSGHEGDQESLRFFLVERYPLFSQRASRTYEAAMLHSPWHLYRLEVAKRSHACIADLGLQEVVEPIAEVHASPGVDTLMWPPYRLGEMPALVPRSDVPLALTA